MAILDGNDQRAKMVERVLSDSTFICQRYGSAKALTEDQFHWPSDLIVLGDEVTGESCASALHQIRGDQRTRPLPVMILGHAMTHEVISMMECGADGCEIWPTHPGVLVARLRALLRRTYMSVADRPKEIFGAYVLDYRLQRVWVDGQLSRLTPKEFRVIHFMFRHQGTIVTAQDLWECAWARTSCAGAAKRTVAVHISRIRRKLELTGRLGFCLSFVPEKGYRLLKID
ncbi:hypothetical protein WM25_32910 [Burkholderia ubonensis]|nr:hypothetical protein WM25_32910 [Burkholderia ubonensis]